MPWHPDMARIIEAVQSAPSIFDRRPWEVVLAGEARNSVELYANADRAPADISPREVAIGCGAALYNLRLAIRWPAASRRSGCCPAWTRDRR